MDNITLTFKDNLLVIENCLIRRAFQTKNQFAPVSFYNKVNDQECLVPTEFWFRSSINNEIVKSVSYQSHFLRDMQHGGKELKINLEADLFNVNYNIQFFPDCPITREKIIISPKNESLYMNAIGDEFIFIFPEYRINADASHSVEEIRLATWNAEQMSDMNLQAYPVNRFIGPSDDRRGLNLSQCDMYHPVYEEFVPDQLSLHKGPILMGKDKEQNNWILAYEHGSPDNDPSRAYIKIGTEKKEKQLRVWVSIIKGAFFNDETFTKGKPFESPWIHFGTFSGKEFDDGKKAFWDFLYFWQSETRSGRDPLIYYNTWGWQRDEENDYLYLDEIRDIRQGQKVYGDAAVYKPVHYKNIQDDGGVRKHYAPDEVLLNLPRLKQEIEHASFLGADVFVLDDGWYDWMGDWQVNPALGEEGLRNIAEEIKKNHLRMGIWLAPMCIDPHSQFFKDHQELMARNLKGEINPSRFGRKMACLVSPGFEDGFIKKCKRLIDLGCTYFKWDALDGWYCHSAEHNHGNINHTAEERGHRYGYECVHAINRMAAALIDYCPELVIAYDVTESGRFVGLDWLSRGRYFWMNNGASGYYDYSSYRAKSMRTIYYRYHKIIPPGLIPSAQYPHALRLQPTNRKAANSQVYKIYSTLVGGNGFWGNLSKMDKAEQETVNEIITAYRNVASSVVSTRPKITGCIGSSPEIYEALNTEQAQGQIIAFSGSICRYKYCTEVINRKRFVGVLHHGFTLDEDDKLYFNFEFIEPDDCHGAFIIGNNSSGMYVEKSTCWLSKLELIASNRLLVKSGAPGEISIVCSGSKDSFDIKYSKDVEHLSTEHIDNKYRFKFIFNDKNCIVNLSRT